MADPQKQSSHARYMLVVHQPLQVGAIAILVLSAVAMTGANGDGLAALRLMWLAPAIASFSVQMWRRTANPSLRSGRLLMGFLLLPVVPVLAVMSLASSGDDPLGFAVGVAGHVVIFLLLAVISARR